MNVRSSATLVIFLVVVVSTFSCGPYIRPELQKEIDDTIKKYGSASRKVVYDNADNVKIKPWRVGQWVLLKSIDRDNNVSLVKVSITKQQGTAFVIETSSSTYFGKSDTALFIDGFNHTDVTKMKILKAKFRNQQGKITEVPEEQLNEYNISDTFLQIIKQSNKAGQKDTVNINNLVFKDCIKSKVDLEINSVILVTGDANVWFHSEVPIYGYAKSVVNASSLWIKISSIDEVLDFGETGAKSVFFPND